MSSSLRVWPVPVSRECCKQRDVAGNSVGDDISRFEWRLSQSGNQWLAACSAKHEQDIPRNVYPLVPKYK